MEVKYETHYTTKVLFAEGATLNSRSPQSTNRHIMHIWFHPFWATTPDHQDLRKGILVFSTLSG